MLRAYALTCPAAIQIYWNKRNCLHKKRVPQDGFGTTTWPQFPCGTPIRLLWRLSILSVRLKLRLWKKSLFILRICADKIAMKFWSHKVWDIAPGFPSAKTFLDLRETGSDPRIDNLLKLYIGPVQSICVQRRLLVYGSSLNFKQRESFWTLNFRLSMTSPIVLFF